MSSPPTQPRRPGTRRFVVAGLMVAAAIAIGAVVAFVIVRALIGYDIEPFPADEPTTVAIGDRPVAIWVSPEQALGSCTVTGADGDARPIRSSSTRVTISTTSRSWTRVGVVDGAPGTTVTVVCSSGPRADGFGFAPNPRIARYVVLGLVGGGIAALLVVGAFVLALVTAVQRSKARPAV